MKRNEFFLSDADKSAIISNVTNYYDSYDALTLLEGSLISYKFVTQIMHIRK